LLEGDASVGDPRRLDGHAEPHAVTLPEPLG
jgi:hypothetical protein